MKRSHNKYTKWLFLWGLGSATKITLLGVISFSELAAFIIAPYLLMTRMSDMRRGGVLLAIWLPLAMVAGNFVVNRMSGDAMFVFIKQTAMFYSISAQVIVMYYLLSRCVRGIGWLALGGFFSQIISAFAFNPRVVVTGSEQVALETLSVEESMSNVLFWFPKFNSLMTMPLKFNYLGMPTWLAVTLILVSVAFTILISSSGRSACAMLFLSATVIFIGRRSRLRMRAIGKHIVLFVMTGLFAAVIVKNVYVFTASRGILGENARIKYQNQIKNDSLLGVLMGGRAEFFVGLKAMFDHPFLGFVEGPEDRKGYYRDFIAKYGSAEDLEAYERGVLRRQEMGQTIETIPIHSAIQQFWSCAGISGLIFWCWVLYLMFMYFKRYAPSIPQWFGWLAMSIPGAIFTIFFNPYNRAGIPTMIAALLVVRAIYYKRLPLPFDMEMEAEKYDH